MFIIFDSGRVINIKYIIAIMPSEEAGKVKVLVLGGTEYLVSIETYAKITTAMKNEELVAFHEYLTN